MRAEASERASDKLAQLSRQGLDLMTFWRHANDVLAGTVKYFESPCWFTFDPASLLITSHFHDGLRAIPRTWLSTEYYEDDVYKLASVARSQRGIATLHEATGGDPSRSKRWHDNVAYGGDQEMIAGLRTRDGAVWGALALYRAPDEPLFDNEELNFIRSIAVHLAEGARRGLLVGEAIDRDWPDAPGLVVLSDKGRVESWTPGTERWLDELPDTDPSPDVPPASVLAVAARALQTASADLPFARVLSRSGVWLVLHGAILMSGPSPRVAVIIEPAHPARISPLLMSAYGLSERERDVTRLVLRGYSTVEISDDLVLSGHTVQQHLKSIFDKTGVRSRRDLIGKVFFAYYEPRVRDNERRADTNLPLRGGPRTGIAS